MRVEDLAPWLRRVVLGGAGLAGVESTGVGDECLRVMFPAAGETEPALPEAYEALDADTKAALDALWESDRLEEEIEDEYDERLTALGL